MKNLDFIYGDLSQKMVIQVDECGDIIERYSDVDVASSWVEIPLSELLFYIRTGNYYIDADGNKYRFIVEEY